MARFFLPPSVIFFLLFIGILVWCKKESSPRKAPPKCGTLTDFDTSKIKSIYINPDNVRLFEYQQIGD